MSYEKERDGGNFATIFTGSTAGLVVILFIVCMAMYGCPQYKVYSQRMEGESELAKATYSKQVAVQEALAKKEAATNLAEADVVRAGGVARANSIIGNSLKDNEAYLRYLYIQALENKQGEVIYVPTEAGLPILEANRLRPAK